MNTDYQDSKHKKLTEKIIKIFYRVYNRLGYGFLEKVYENVNVRYSITSENKYWDTDEHRFST